MVRNAILATAVITVFSVEFAAAIELECHNKFMLNICAEQIKSGELNNPIVGCVPNMMKKPFIAKVNTGTEMNEHEFPNSPIGSRKNSIPSFADQTQVFKSYNGTNEYWMPHRGSLSVLAWNGEKTSTVVEINALNSRDSGDVSGTRDYQSKFLYQTDSLEMLGEVLYHPDISAEPKLEILVKGRDDPYNNFVYRIEAFCRLLKDDPFDGPKTKQKDVDNVFN